MPVNLPIAVHAFLERKDQILLLKRYNTGHNDNKWSVPAGRLESGESISQAVVREVKEEVGLSIEVDSLSRPLIMHHKDERGERIYAFFMIEKWLGKEVNMEPDKCSEINWFNRKDIPENLVPHVKKALFDIEKGQTYTEYGF